MVVLMEQEKSLNRTPKPAILKTSIKHMSICLYVLVQYLVQSFDLYLFINSFVDKALNEEWQTGYEC
jgi:hypothetical protein